MWPWITISQSGEGVGEQTAVGALVVLTHVRSTPSRPSKRKKQKEEHKKKGVYSVPGTVVHVSPDTTIVNQSHRPTAVAAAVVVAVAVAVAVAAVQPGVSVLDVDRKRLLLNTEPRAL